MPSPVPVPNDALIEPRWSPAAAQRRPRSPPHRPSEETMLPPIPRTGSGAARSRPEPGRRRNRHRYDPARQGPNSTRSLIEVFAHEKYRFVAGDSHDGPSARFLTDRTPGSCWESRPTASVAQAANHGEEGPMGHPQQGRRPGRYGWSAECRAMTERQLLECFVTTNDPDAFRVLIERHGPMVLAVCRSVLAHSTTSRTPSRIRSWPWPGCAHTIKHSEHLGRGSVERH